MIYALVYLIISAIYGYIVFMKNPEKNNISPMTQLMFGTTWGLHLLNSLVLHIYRLVGVHIYYLVTVKKEK